MIAAEAATPEGSSETDETSQRTRSGGEGPSLTPRKASACSGNPSGHITELIKTHYLYMGNSLCKLLSIVHSYNVVYTFVMNTFERSGDQ